LNTSSISGSLETIFHALSIIHFAAIGKFEEAIQGLQGISTTLFRGVVEDPLSGIALFTSLIAGYVCIGTGRHTGIYGLSKSLSESASDLRPQVFAQLTLSAVKGLNAILHGSRGDNVVAPLRKYAEGIEFWVEELPFIKAWCLGVIALYSEHLLEGKSANLRAEVIMSQLSQ